MTYRKHANDLLVDWALLGTRGWWIDESGAEAADLDSTETMWCHLDRTTLDILMCGPAWWCAARLQELADAGVPDLRIYRTWQVLKQAWATGTTVNITPCHILAVGEP